MSRRGFTLPSVTGGWLGGVAYAAGAMRTWPVLSLAGAWILFEVGIAATAARVYGLGLPVGIVLVGAALGMMIAWFMWYTRAGLSVPRLVLHAIATLAFVGVWVWAFSPALWFAVFT